MPCLPLILFTLAAPAAAAGRPNVIIMMADDMGYSDVGCYGSEIATPNIDGLAADGLRFTQFYNTGRCCPTRAALLTGLYPHAAGVGHMTANKGYPSYQGFLNDRCVTVAEGLKSAGYTTLMAGKWHVGGKPHQWPHARGFDRSFGTPSGGGVYFKGTLKVRKGVYFVEGDRRLRAAELPDDLYVTETFTDYALKFLDEASGRGKPFFLYLAHIAPHWPLQAKPADIAKYKGEYDAGWGAIRAARFAKQKRLGVVTPEQKLSRKHWQVKRWQSKPAEERRDLARRMEIYAAQIDCIDQNIGRLVAKLRELNALDDTLILFLSDNGCSAEGGPGGFSRGRKGAPIGTALSYASAGLEWANVCDTPLRKFKTFTHEGGISTPLIAHWPNGITRRGAIDRTAGHVVDLLPTCLELAGAAYPKSRDGKPVKPTAGRSLVPAFAGKSVPRPEGLFWEHQGNKAVRLGEWKLVKTGKKPWELYHLGRDRAEANDLAAAMPAKVKELKSLWRKWADRDGVKPWPVRKPK